MNILQSQYTKFLERKLKEKNEIINKLAFELEKAKINNELNLVRANEIYIISNVNGNEKTTSLAKHIVFSSEQHIKDETKVLSEYDFRRVK